MCLFYIMKPHPGMPHKTKFLSSLGYDQAQAKLLMQQRMGLDEQLTTWVRNVLVSDLGWESQEKVVSFHQYSASSNIPGYIIRALNFNWETYSFGDSPIWQYCRSFQEVKYHSFAARTLPFLWLITCTNK